MLVPIWLKDSSDESLLCINSFDPADNPRSKGAQLSDEIAASAASALLSKLI